MPASRPISMSPPAQGRQFSELGYVTQAGSTTLRDDLRDWTPDAWVDGVVIVLSGAAQGDVRTITSNTSAELTPSEDFSAALAVGDQYALSQAAGAGAAAIVDREVSDLVVLTQIRDELARLRFDRELESGRVYRDLIP